MIAWCCPIRDKIRPGGIDPREMLLITDKIFPRPVIILGGNLRPLLILCIATKGGRLAAVQQGGRPCVTGDSDKKMRNKNAP